MRLSLLVALTVALCLGLAPVPAQAQSVDDELILLRSRLESLENDFGSLLRAHQELVKLQQDQATALEKAQAQATQAAQEAQAVQQAPAALSAADKQALTRAQRDTQTAAQTAQEAARSSEEVASALAALRSELLTLTEDAKVAVSASVVQAEQSARQAQEALVAVQEAQEAEDTEAKPEATQESAEAETSLANANSPEVRLLLGRLEELEGLQRATTGSLEQLEYRLRSLEQSLASAFSAAPPESGVQAESLDELSTALTPEQAEAGTVRTLGEVSDTSLQEAARESAASASVSLATLSRDQPATEPVAEVAATPQEQYAVAFALLRSNQYAEAETELRNFLERWPEDALADNARYWLGETLYVRKEYQAAARVFAEGLDRAPDGAKAPDNLLKLGLSFSSLGENEKACQVLLSLTTRYAEAPETILRRADAERNRLACS